MSVSDCYTKIEFLYNFTKIDNLASIIKLGILSKNEIKRLNIKNKDISNQDVQSKRDLVKIPKVRNVKNSELHDYANLYFNVRNAMMYDKINSEDINSLCVICVDKKVLDLGTTIVTNRNAASKKVDFLSPKDGLKYIDFEKVNAYSWNDSNQYIKNEKRSIKSAETLVLRSVPPRFIRKIKVPTIEALNKVKSLNLGVDVEIDKDIFFLI